MLRFLERPVHDAAHGRLFVEPAELPEGDVAIVPGAGVLPNGEPCAPLEDRLEAARSILSHGRVSRVLVSGSAPEVDVMARWLARAGVDEQSILRDPRGLRTRLTMERAARIFALRAPIVCSNAFHLPRCIYLARAFGLDAVGLVADRRAYRSALRNELRESLARTRSVLEELMRDRGQ
jgi:SanA protein